MCKIIQLTRRFYILGSASNKMRRFFFFFFFFPPVQKEFKSGSLVHYIIQHKGCWSVQCWSMLGWTEEMQSILNMWIPMSCLCCFQSSCQNNFGVWVSTNHGHIQMYTFHTSLQYVDFTRIWVRSVSPDGRDGGRITAGINSSAFLILKPLNIF